MLHMTAGILGNEEFSASLAKKLGKQGTTNDIAIYNHGSSEGVMTYVTVNSDKIQPLLQAINMIDVPVMAINEINAVVGEQIMAISEFEFDNGFLVLENVSEDHIKSMTKGTCVENFRAVKDSVELVQELKKISVVRPDKDLLIPIDNYFNVKSVGTVVLGIVKSGTVKKYDKVVIEPIGKELVVKGIQSQDRDIETASAGTRVGMSLKGIEADEIRRGYVIGKTEKSKSFRLCFNRSKYSKEQPKENDQIFISSGLQVAVAKVKSLKDNVLEVDTENYVAYTKNTKFLIASTRQQIPRIIGRAKICK